MKKILLLVLILAVVVSYFKSNDIYSFYTRMWFEKIEGVSAEELVEKTDRRIVDAKAGGYGEEELAELTNDIKKMKTAYPGVVEFEKALGYALMMGENEIEGALILATIPSERRVPDPFFESMIRVLYEEGYYSDIVAYMNRYGFSANPNINYRHGASLILSARKGHIVKEEGSEPEEVKIEYLRTAVERLEAAVRGGKRDYLTLGMLGSAYCDLGETKKCINILEEARKMKSRDPFINRNLAEAYREAGRYQEAREIFLILER